VKKAKTAGKAVAKKPKTVAAPKKKASKKA
jgi:hypothetical protein